MTGPDMNAWRAVVEEVRAVVDDREQAHLHEHGAYVAALRWIAESSTDRNAVAVAREVLKVREIVQERWYD